MLQRAGPNLCPPTQKSPLGYHTVGRSNVEQLGKPVRLRLAAGGYFPVDMKPLDIPHKGGKALLRFVGFDEFGQLEQNMRAIDPDNLVSTAQENRPYYVLPATMLSGFGRVALEDGREAVSFTSYEDPAEEPEPQLLVPESFAWGIHNDHRGNTENGILPEKPGWYIAGTQVKITGSPTNPYEEVIGKRAFSLARIVDGPLGDPRDNAFRLANGLY